jgi:hypothetical protein
MLTRELIRLVALSGACVLPAACATTSYSRSGVVAVPPGVKGKAGSNATVEIEGLKVRLESLDYAKRQDTIPSFALRLVFDPRELGYSFDPARGSTAPDSSPRVRGAAPAPAPRALPRRAITRSPRAAASSSRSTWHSVPKGGSSWRSLAWRGDASVSIPSRCRSPEGAAARSTVCTGSRSCSLRSPCTADRRRAPHLTQRRRGRIVGDRRRR